MHLKEITLKNFKSFKDSTIKFSHGVTAIVGPNGSGKSNIVDAIRFVFGEKRMKKLRVKSVSKLIYLDHTKAYVKAVLEEDGKVYEIKRTIKRDGKVGYFINDKKVSFSSYKEFLRRKGIRAVDTFVIAQGEITRITLMPSKERRMFIDEISGIAEFEEKKKEALRELSVVDEKIKEVSIIIGEKLKYLEQLKKEKEIAEKYEQKKNRLDNIRASLIKMNIDEIEKKLEGLNKKLENLTAKKKELEEILKKVEEEIQKIYKNKDLLDKEIEVKTKQSQIYKKLESLRTEKAVLEEKLNSFFEKEKSLNQQIEEIKKELESLEKRKEEAEKEIKQSEKDLAEIKIEDLKKVERKSIELRAKYEGLKEKLQEIDKLMIKGEEKLNSINNSIEENEKLLSLLEENELDLSSFEKELKQLEEQNRRTFSKEKELNNKIADFDRKIIKIREKLAVLRASVGNLRVNPIDVFLSDLVKSGKLEGFYGKAIDLIEFDDRFSNAVEAAAGGRLNYYVVDSLDVAKKAIEMIKKMKLGRATFIPLKDLRVNKPEKHPNMLSNFIYPSLNLPNIDRVIDFLFSATLVVDNFEEARKLIGKHRIVTLDGELFETTAVVSGGKGKGTITAKKAIESLTKELEETVEKRKEALRELNELKEEISRIRSRRAFLENKIKEIEKLREEQEKVRKKREELINNIRKLKEDKTSIEDALEKLRLKREEISIDLSKLEKELKEELKKEEEEFGEELSERERLIRKKVGLEERIASLKKELEEIKTRREGLTKKLKELEKEKVELEGERRKIEDRYRILSAEITGLEEEFSKKEEEIRELIKKNKEMEERLMELSKKDRLVREGISNAEKITHKIEVEKASLETRLEDLKEELSKYPNFVFIEGERGRLLEEMSALEKEIEEMGDINFAARDLYYQLYDEIGEIKERLDRLKIEKDKIIELIAEIDERKKESFFTHLKEINKNFQSLFNNISNFGLGSLYLEDPENPFETGLNMKLIRDGREIPLESLSGGEQTIMSLLFIFALQMTKPSPFYVLDEIDAALDKLNSKRMAELIKNLSRNSQIIIVSHNDIVISSADSVIGVTKQDYSKAVQVKADVFEVKSET